jgi:drug/metabolite transporter (DMT)-like permease
MLYLMGSIFLSAWLNVVFKLCSKFGINTFQTIVCNYGFCVMTGMLMSSGVTQEVPVESHKWAVILGLGFLSTFYLTALTVRHNGVATATVATKVSLIIPFTFSLIFYGDAFTGMKMLGILLTIVAVILTLMPSQEQKLETVDKKNLLLPWSIFLGCGILDTIVKFVEHYHLSEATAGVFLRNCFTTAFGLGVVVLIISLIKGKIQFQPKAIVSGLLLGVPNYFSIWCLIQFLKIYPDNSSVWIPVNNVSIVIVNVLVGLLIFKERVSTLNKWGIGLALLAITILSATS